MIFKSLQFKLSVLFVAILIMMSAGYIYTATQSTGLYLAETTQKLHQNLAATIADQIDIDRKTNYINEAQVLDIFDNAKRYNPTIGVYLVDLTGKVKVFSSGCSVEEPSVSIKKIETFLKGDQQFPIFGDDPVDPSTPRIFSAHLIKTGDETPLAYLYVTLGCVSAASTEAMIAHSYALRILVVSLVVALLAAMLIGLAMIALLTKDLWRFVTFIQKIQGGDFSKRIHVSSSSELKALANAFNEMAAKIEHTMNLLKENEKLLREFIANISHDLRTPLASIEGYMETIILKKHLLSEKEKQQYFNTILKNTRTLNRLVNQLLDLSKLEARQVKLKPEPFSITELIQDVMLKFNPQATASNISLNAHFPSHTPFVFADLGLIDRVLQNLIGNAFNHTEENGCIDVEIEMLDEYTMYVRVQDTGKGIAPEDLKHIFDRFYQGDKVRSKHKSGAGLGLTIAKKIMELHHSTLDVESTLGVGTTFSFKLPVYVRVAECNKLLQDN
ncbi:integral membrane sensor signal transduction histidine kinase [Chloroherpeton thalassium ATCC 35110]|uniref:histidine kinase n=1 Tax=Chloroherpeton thalassium (strain ATCC 35110 / GB-78) TaxID=517418 RepID=B3QW39_CHLT3|nr:HAMP domain-containing sensor histidine kinase [Chloroherpeton thalassium]ACF14693.1 integral membrane sensor signal transduction histidine kinase [Chloroherpeton thalassium ATCC 35110]